MIASFVDWDNAFPRVCPKLGIQSFLENGVRPSIIPLLVNYFQNRKMSVKWHDCFSTPILINGGGPQGATLGILVYLSLSNSCSKFIETDNKYRFIDDLTVLEIVDLLSLKIEKFDVQKSVPNDIPVHNNIVDPEELVTQANLNNLERWTDQKKMVLNSRKTKMMIINFSRNKQFTSRVKLNNQNIGIVDEAKILGKTITSSSSWKKNTDILIKKANARMQLLAKIASFGASVKDLKDVYNLFVRSILEQSSVVWGSSLTREQKIAIERVQKTAVKIISNNQAINYKKALSKLEMKSLEERRSDLSLNFAKKCLQNAKTADYFPIKTKNHTKNLRANEKFKINTALKER